MLFVLFVAGCSQEPLASAPYSQTFDGALGPEWSSKGGGWRTQDGRLWNDGARNVPLWLSLALPHDVRISFTAESNSDAVDLKFEAFGDGEQHASGYVFILGGWKNTKSIIARRDEHGAERRAEETERMRADVKADPEAARRAHDEDRQIVARKQGGRRDHRYQFRLEREGHELRFYVDDELWLDFFDPSPLKGSGHDRFAFNNWASRVWFDDLRIEPL